ncbi:MAG: FGGY-family carbohydrate kinase [Chloroflexaceae bacterium]|jgi:glycerol kinase|nr:FGGY-family carbohydrate kinase [Chloroflexaceae bacterium]
MTDQLLLSVDQGGSGSRAVLLDSHGRVRGYGYRSLGRLYPQPGWVEQEPLAVAASVREAIGEALARAKTSPRQILACGITSQRDTVFAWDGETGVPIGNAITWQDLRTVPLVAETEGWPHAGERRARLGQFPGPYCSAMHMAWRMRHDDAFRAAAESGRLRVTLSAGWLVQALGRQREHALDYSLMQGMTVFDPRRRQLWEEWIAYLNLPRAALPAPRPTLHHFGDLHLTGADGERAEVPVLALIADQQAALFGYDCRRPGQAAATHGTASFINAAVGAQPPPQGVCKTYFAWELGGVPGYTLEADLTVTGAAVRWMQQMGFFHKPAELGPLAASVPDAAGVVFVPAFTGLGVPTEDRSARGTMFGMTLDTSPAHIARAFLDSLGFQMRDILDTMQQEAGVNVYELRVGGGLSASDVACQTQADLLGIPLIRAADTETSARAAGLLAGLAAGVWKSSDDLPDLLAGGATTFEPRGTPSERAERLGRWRRAVERARHWE